MLIEIGGTVLNEDDYDDLLEDIMLDYDFGFPFEILSDVDYKEHRNSITIMRAAEIIILSFVWGSTKEGRAYWEGVYDSLQRIATQGY